jgi:capsular polysaccharide biosynthesis protein
VVDELADVVLLPAHVILDGSERYVVGASFKKTPRQRHFGLTHHGLRRYSLEPPHPLTAERRIDQPVYYLDCEFPDIYGHNLLEVWPQTWALPLLGRTDLLFATSVRLRPYVLEVLGHLGVPPERIVAVTGPVRCARLLLPTPAVKARRYVHPVAHEVFARIAQLGEDAQAQRRARRHGPALYLSRRRVGTRTVTNEKDVQRACRQAGLEVFHPQLHDIATQLAVYARATELVGPGGSAMHNAVFCPPDVQALLLSSTAWFTVVDLLLAAGRHRVGYVFGEPDDEQERGTRTRADYSLDVDLVQSALGEVLGRGARSASRRPSVLRGGLRRR